MDMIKKRAAMRGQSGFTLIELLVAVAILAILAGVAVFAVGSLRGNADTAACNTEKDTIKTANSAANATTETTDSYANYIDGGPTTPNLKYFAVTVPAAPALNGLGTNNQAYTLAAKSGVTLPSGCTTTV
jgi:prepilin-type N-terminal cleavage/methylation domain-containing protein